MQILRAANYKVMPWKNGLGSTTEIAIFRRMQSWTISTGASVWRR